MSSWVVLGKVFNFKASKEILCSLPNGTRALCKQKVWIAIKSLKDITCNTFV